MLRTEGVSGAEHHLGLLVAYLSRYGWTSDVLIAAPDPTKLRPYAERLSSHGGRVTLMQMKHDASPRLLGHLVAARWGGRHDLVHTHLVHADWHAGLASLVARAVPLVSTKHNHDPFRTLPAFRVGERLWLKRCAASIAISDSLAAFVERWSGIRPDTVLYGWPASGVAPRERSTVRELLAVGRLEPQKGFDVLIETIGLLRSGGYDVRLSIAGEGGQRETLQRQIEALGLSASVTLLGYRADVESLMASADVFVHTARWEGFGLVLLEAMRAGLPIVATAVGAIPEVVADGTTGLLVAPDAAAEFAGAVRRLADEPALTAALGVAGHERLASVFTPDRMASRTAAVYAKAVGAAA